MPSGQSPIDIVRAGVEVRPDLPRLQVRYPNTTVRARVRFVCVEGDETDSGRFVVPQVVVEPESDAHVLLGDERHDLQSLHWHSPSEHLLDGEAWPLELHLVHRSAGGDLLVVGVMSAVGDPDAAIAPVFDRLPAVDREDETVTELRLDALVPTTTRAYRYLGSLTTAPFTEGVRWFVCEETRTASPGQIGAHMALLNAAPSGYGDRPRLDGNARSIQALAGRTVVLAD